MEATPNKSNGKTTKVSDVDARRNIQSNFRFLRRGR